MRVRLIAASAGAGHMEGRSAEDVLLFAARASNPEHQDSGKTGLLLYCMRNAEWSIFEQVVMTVEIDTSRVISHQLVRHRSFYFQEFSQRYADVNRLGDMYEQMETPRGKHPTDRQSSLDNLSEDDKRWWLDNYHRLANDTEEFYKESLQRGFAPEYARFGILQSAKSRLYMTGGCRSWVHYLSLRDDAKTQLEHQLVAKQVRVFFKEIFPNTAAAMEIWAQNTAT